MAENTPVKYTGQAMDRRYHGEQAEVTYSLKRCIHAEECIHRLSEVFDTHKRPWINPNGASADALSKTIVHCPSGALHINRADGSVESVPAANTIRLWPNGPLQFSGDLTILGATVDVQHETRATLCRCGASQNKPFCDNSHHSLDFQTIDAVSVIADQPTGSDSVPTSAPRLTITAAPNGPLQVAGAVRIVNMADEAIYAGTATALCRCGHSSHKPFCDGTHTAIGFQAE